MAYTCGSGALVVSAAISLLAVLEQDGMRPLHRQASRRTCVTTCSTTCRSSFLNIDKFSTASIITRLTTDVTNIQNAYQMLIRVAVRSQ
jgi:ABC-type siderophore export system fused ATPase/permease subunit